MSTTFLYPLHLVKGYHLTEAVLLHLSQSGMICCELLFAIDEVHEKQSIKYEIRSSFNIRSFRVHKWKCVNHEEILEKNQGQN